MAHSPHRRGSSFGCLSVLRPEIQSVSEKRSMALLGGPVRTLNRCSLADKYKLYDTHAPLHSVLGNNQQVLQVTNQVTNTLIYFKVQRGII